MKSSKSFMVVQTITPLSLIDHQHPFHTVNNKKPLALQPPPPPNISDHFLSKGNMEREQDFVGQDDLYKCINKFLIFGKCIGVVPFSGVFTWCGGGELNRLSFRKFSISAVFSLSIICILCCNTALALTGFFRGGGRDATQLAKNAAGLICYSMGLYVFIFIFRNAQKLIDLLHQWRAVDVDFAAITHTDERLGFSINLISGLILTSAIAENAVSHLPLFPLHSETVQHPLQYYYENSHKQWAALIPYHPVMAIWVFLCNKWAVYAWNFGDIFIAIISRALYGKFKGFLASFKEKLKHKSCGKSDWLEAIQHHDRLSKLTKQFSDLLSPLVFTSFAVNIYFICIQLHYFLAPSNQPDVISSLYVTWSFLHLVMRTYTVALCAAKINDYAHDFMKTLCDCPRHLFNVDVERAERKLFAISVNLHGFGTFYIGRPFILSVISVIFTFEIVLLQTSQMMVPPLQPKEAT